MLLKYSSGVSDSWGVVVDQARRPTDAELRRNSRARSAVLHVHRKSRGTRLSDLEAKAGAALNWAPHVIPVPAEQELAAIVGRGRREEEEEARRDARRRSATRRRRRRRRRGKKAKKARRGRRRRALLEMLNDVKPEAQPLRQHDRAQPHLKIDVRVRRDDRPGLVATLRDSPSRRRRASRGACTAACRRCSCRPGGTPRGPARPSSRRA